MKIAPIIFLVLVALSASYARPSEENCNQDPSVYCKTEEKARLCRKTEFCAEYNRKRSQPTIVQSTPPQEEDKTPWYENLFRVDDLYFGAGSVGWAN